MGDTVKEVTDVVEEITGTTDVAGSFGVFASWVVDILNLIATSEHPTSVAAQHATIIAQHKDALAAAVTANTANPVPPVETSTGD